MSIIPYMNYVQFNDTKTKPVYKDTCIDIQKECETIFTIQENNQNEICELNEINIHTKKNNVLKKYTELCISKCIFRKFFWITILGCILVGFGIFLLYLLVNVRYVTFYPPLDSTLNIY